MAGLQLSGLFSGMDTEAIITKMMALEQVPRTRLQLSQGAAEARQQALRDVESRLKSLRTSAQDLGSVSLWAPTQWESVAPMCGAWARSARTESTRSSN